MRHLSIAVIVLCLLCVVQNSYAQDRSLGLGVMIGEPTGFSAKLWTSNYNAYDFGLGWSVIGNRNNSDNRIQIHADYLWHVWNVIHSTDRFPLYYGIGGRFIGSGNESSFAVRTVFGIAWMPIQIPMDLFLELAPSIKLTPSTGFALNAAIGARYYF
jgi:hypothetical protein